MANAADFRSSVERTRSLTQQIEEEVATLAYAAETAMGEARISAAHSAAAAFNSVAQRLRQADDDDEWSRTLVEAASEYATKALWIARSEDAAPAVRSAIESGETTVCAVTAGELGDTAELLSECARAWLIPVGARGSEPLGVLCAADAHEPELASLELLGCLAAGSAPVRS
ncbi:MAG TPA: hypothetical protein VES20_07935, partial [Bryobacteraceae bacterium]|nr:hypothetical protein [Bryobacteraceae bacterium]